MRFINEGIKQIRSEGTYIGDLHEIGKVLISLCSICRLYERCGGGTLYFKDGVAHLNAEFVNNKDCEFKALERNYELLEQRGS